MSEYREGLKQVESALANAMTFIAGSYARSDRKGYEKDPTFRKCKTALALVELLLAKEEAKSIPTGLMEVKDE